MSLGKGDSSVNEPKRIKHSTSELSQQEFGYRLNTKSSTQEHQDDLNATQRIGLNKQLMVHGSEVSVPEPEMKRSRKSRLLRPAVQSAKEISGHIKDAVKHKLTPSIKQFAKSTGSTDKPKKKTKIRFADQLVQDNPKRSPLKHSNEGFVSDMHRKIDQRPSNMSKQLTGSPLRGQPIRPMVIPAFELSKLAPAREFGTQTRGQNHKKVSQRSRSSGQGQIPSKREQCLVSPMESLQRLKGVSSSLVSPPLSSRRGKEQITDKLLKLQRNQFIDPVTNFMKAFGSR